MIDKKMSEDQLFNEIKQLRKQLEDEKKIRNLFQKNEAQLRSLLEHSPDYIIILDLNGKVEYLNRIYSFRKWEDVIGHNIRDFFLPEYQKLFDEKFTEAVQTGSTTSITTQAPGPEKDLIWYDCRFTPIKSNQRIEAIIFIARDITQKKETEEVLIRIMKAFQNTSDAIGISDPNGHHFFQNEAFTKLFEYTAEELEAAGGGPKVYADKAIAQKVFDEIMAGRSWNGEVEMISKSGRNFTVFLRADAITNDKGKIIDLIGVHTDISNRKNTEYKLKESEETLRSIVTNAPVIIMSVDSEGTILSVNRTVQSYTVEETIGTKIYDYTPLEHHQMLKEKIKRAFQTGEPDSFEVKYIGVNNELLWYSTRIGPVKQNDKVIYLILISTDITDRVNTELKLRESEEKFRMMAEQSFLGIIILQDGIIKYLNEMMTTISEYSVQEVLNWEPDRIYNSIHPEDRAIAIEDVQNAFKGLIKKPKISDYRLITKSGKIKWVQGFSKIIKYEGRLAIFSTFLDITYEKNVEKELKKSKENFHEAYIKSELLKDIFAHDINNILQNILSSSEILSIYLKDLEKFSANDDILKIIKDQVKRGSNLVLTVQKLSKMDEYKASLTPVEIMAVLDKAINHITQNLEEKTYDIRIESTEKKYFIKANELLIDIFENIILNAIKHNIEPIKRIEIKVYKEEINDKKLVKMEFEDNGIGIKDSWKDEVFARGYEHNSNKRGLGIGLYLVKRIIDQYNGQIWVEDRIQGEYSRGSKFILRFLAA